MSKVLTVTKTKYYVRSGRLNTVRCANSPREAAVTTIVEYVENAVDPALALIVQVNEAGVEAKIDEDAVCSMLSLESLLPDMPPHIADAIREVL